MKRGGERAPSSISIRFQDVWVSLRVWRRRVPGPREAIASTGGVIGDRTRAERGSLNDRVRKASVVLQKFVRRVFLCAGLGVMCLSAMTPSPVGASQNKPTSDEIKKRLDTLSPEYQVTYLQSLRAGNPRNAKVSFYLGNAFLGFSKPDSAVVYYEEAVAADSMYSKAHVNLGIALERLARIDDAKVHYEKAIDIDSTDVLAYCHLGHYYHVRGEVGEAVKRYIRAIAIDPESAQARYNLGLAFADTRLFAEALREWRKVIALDPDSELGRTAAENVRLIETYVDMDRGSSKRP